MLFVLRSATSHCLHVRGPAEEGANHADCQNAGSECNVEEKEHEVFHVGNSYTIVDPGTVVVHLLRE